jgi:hypothetical protein
MTDEDEFELDWSKARLVKPASEHDLIRRGDALKICDDLMQKYATAVYDKSAVKTFTKDTPTREQNAAKVYCAGEIHDALAALERVKAEARSDVAGLVEALRDISRQKKTDELDTEHDVEFADFEGGYDACIDRARAALAAWGGRG